MNYDEAMIFIEHSLKYGSVLGLLTIKELLKRLGDPQNQLKFIHIAGTNGKGSTLAYISTILTNSGLRIGRYISPVIFEYRERIQINEEYISEEGIAEGITSIKEAVDDMVAAGLPHPTVFEIETALGFLYFAKNACDIVVLEVGLGGRDDATNVITTSICSVITSISLDHMQILGDTVEEIAACKAGIIKKGTPVILGFGQKSVMEVVKEQCVICSSKLCITAPEKVKYCGYKDEIQFFSYGIHENLSISLRGQFQIENACIAIEVIEELRRQGYHITQEALEHGLMTTKWPGRFQKINSEPLIYVDGAHNSDSARRLIEAIELYFTNTPIIYIIGVLEDKDYKSVIDITLDKGKVIYTITPNNSRGLPGEELAEYIRSRNRKAEASDSLLEALNKAIKQADNGGVIIAFGSLSFLGDFMKLVQERQHGR